MDVCVSGFDMCNVSIYYACANLAKVLATVRGMANIPAFNNKRLTLFILKDFQSVLIIILNTLYQFLKALSLSRCLHKYCKRLIPAKPSFHTIK